ncbi:hypothetical protein BC30048_p2061 (plasmid) [Bacillus cereus]|uniref:hypothetical protein n=1 Tax=Bacillus cereus TaxID=1396 RepID=UPI001F171257|nr:hypothetical protein [Bacillus cereus]BCC15049.1 hypothetical protein BCM0074_p1053 [Bacillus cereus]BCD02886.1 hypothetical protein BC30048_p2061 [Bacillus cereus]
MAANVTSKDIKKQKDMITIILKTQGEKYNNWLYNIHQEFIDTNQDVVMKALAAFAAGGVLEDGSSDSKDEQEEEKEEKEENEVKTHNASGTGNAGVSNY